MFDDFDALFGGIQGSGGGSSTKGGSSSSSNESSNTLRSDNRAKLLELISEGPCLGLVNGGTSIYLDETPVVNANNTANFRGVQWDVRHGTADQTAIPGNAQVETPFGVGVPVTAAQGGVVRTIIDDNTTSVRVVVQVDALARTDSSGEIKPTDVSWLVEVASNNGGFQTADQVNLVNQKTNSPYQQASMVPLPPGGAPWTIRVSRLTPDSDTVELQNAIRWVSYTEIVAGNFTYPNSAMVYLDIDADLFDASSIPARAYDWYGLLLQIPSNYDPVGRHYNGMWDGSFNTAWSNNPAWVFYDLITNDRYGLGQFIDADKVDKWSLYQIAQYCDQPVPDGYGGTEPRYTFNGAITGRDEAYRVLQSITSAWRGMAFWSLGQVFATIDAPKDAIKLVTPANVIGGHFNYSGTAMKARHTVALVTWNDPNDFYRPAVEVIINNDMVTLYGWRETSIQAIGCTSRSLAHRYGKWVLDTEQYETETIEYQASWDHATVKPGDLIAVGDPGKAGTRTGGRLLAIDGQAQIVTLDVAFVPESGSSYNFLVEGPLGGIQSRQVAQFDGARVILSSPLSPAPGPNAMWVITGTDVNRRMYSVLSVKEDAQNLFTITGLFHDPNKYARVEQGIYFDPIPYYRPKSTIKPPTNFKGVESLYQIDGHYASRLLLSWTPGDDFQSRAFHLSASTPKGHVDYGVVSVPALDIENSAIGTYQFTLSAIGLSNQNSSPVTLTIEVSGWLSQTDLYVSGLELQGQGADTTFVGKSFTIDWINNFPKSGYDIAQDKVAGAGTKNPFYRDNVIEVQDQHGNLLRTEVITTDRYTYDYDYNVSDNIAYGQGPQRQVSLLVQVRDTQGQISEPDEITVDNPVPDMVVPNVVGGLDTVFVIYDVPSDRDFVGALIWMSEDEHFDPLTTTPAYDGPNNAVGLAAANLKTYYVRMACYDSFGKDGLNICPPIVVFTGNRLFDKDPPAVPTGLTLLATNVTMPTGEVVQALQASWDASPSDNFAYFSVEIRTHRDDGDDGTGGTGAGWIGSNVDKPTYQWAPLVANTAYDIQVRSFSVGGYPSNYAISANFTMPPKTTPPGSPTAFEALASFKSLFLNWTNPVDSDLADVEVYVGPSTDFSQATLVGKSYTNAFTYPVGTTGTALYAWIKAMNTSGLYSPLVGPVTATPVTVAHIDLANGIVAAENVIAGTLTSDQIRAGSIVGDSLSIDSYIPATMVVGKTGITMGAVTDPATLVNANQTVIEPGKILISGSTYLSDWRNGSDFTKIEGGSIAANSITANKLTIGSRGITVSDLQFGYDKLNSIVNWTAGVITWTASDGTTQSVSIPAGAFQWTGSGYQYPCTYVAWQEGATALTATMDITQVTGASFIQMATYRGFDNLVATYGRTVIDGSNVVTGSITAAQLYVGELITNAVQIDAGIIQNVHLAGNITFDRMAGGTLYSTQALKIGGDRFIIDSIAQNLTIRDEQGYNDGTGHPGRPRIVLGNLGGSGTNYGIAMFAADGTLQMAIGDSQGINTHAIPGFGNLAAQNTVDRSQTTSFGTLSAQNTVDYGQMTGVGQWATVNQLFNGNAASLIASGAIAGTYISDLTADKITSGTVTARMAAVSGSFDAVDPRTGFLRARMGLQPGVDYGLFVWDSNANPVITSTGVTGTFIQDLTVGTLKILDGAISVSAGAFAGGINSSVAVGISVTGDASNANLLITFAGTAIATSNSTGQGYLYLDGKQIYSGVLISTASAPVTTGVSMTYMLSVSSGYHTIKGQITGTQGVIQPHDLSITATVLFK